LIALASGVDRLLDMVTVVNVGGFDRGGMSKEVGEAEHLELDISGDLGE
jgi:hypothetical protein